MPSHSFGPTEPGRLVKTVDGSFVAAAPSPPFLHMSDQTTELIVRSTVEIMWLWIGAITDTACIASVRMRDSNPEIRLVVSESLDFSDRIYSTTGEATAATFGIARVQLTGLKPFTKYFVRVAIGQTINQGQYGEFKTMPVPLSPASFSFAAGSCINNNRVTQSGGSVYPPVLKNDPLFFLHIGDFFYQDLTNQVSDFRDMWDFALSSVNQRHFYARQGVFYMWDDHDYGINDGDINNPARPAAISAYRNLVPHTTLVDSNASASVYYAFTVGRCRFIVTDNRSSKSPRANTDNSSKSVLGTTQKAWFKQELLDARDGGYAAIFWISTFGWIGLQAGGTDQWTGYATERAELSNFIANNDITKLHIISGDMHALAFDDGSHSDYSSVIGKNARVPVFHVAPLSQSASQKGGPYWIGPIPFNGSANRRQFGLITVTDTGGPTVSLTFTGKNADNTTLLQVTQDSAYRGPATDTRFAVIGDYGDSSNPMSPLMGEIVDGLGVGFIVTVGDNWYGTLNNQADLEQSGGFLYRKWIFPYKGTSGSTTATQQNFYAALGNHDRDPSARFAVSTNFFSTPTVGGLLKGYYSVVRGNVEFFFYDSGYDNSQTIQQADGVAVGSVQATWLQSALAASTAHWKIVICHHPPYCSTQTVLSPPLVPGDGTLSYVELRLPFQAWGADLVLSGHAHNYERVNVSGLNYLICGCTGHSLADFVSSPPAYSQVRIKDYGALRGSANATTLKMEFVSKDFIVQDTLTLTKP